LAGPAEAQSAADASGPERGTPRGAAPGSRGVGARLTAPIRDVPGAARPPVERPGFVGLLPGGLLVAGVRTAPRTQGGPVGVPAALAGGGRAARGPARSRRELRLEHHPALRHRVELGPGPSVRPHL